MRARWQLIEYRVPWRNSPRCIIVSVLAPPLTRDNGTFSDASRLLRENALTTTHIAALPFLTHSHTYSLNTYKIRQTLF